MEQQANGSVRLVLTGMALAVSLSLGTALMLTILATLYLGILPGRVLTTLENARDQIMIAK